MQIGNTCRERVKGSVLGTVSFYAYPWLQDQMKQYHVGRLIEEDGCGGKSTIIKKDNVLQTTLGFRSKGTPPPSNTACLFYAIGILNESNYII